MDSVISSNPQPNEAHTSALPISTFSETKMAKSTNGTMFLEKEGAMAKQCFVLNSHVYIIPLSKLRPFSVHNPFGTRLSNESYCYLMRSFGGPAGKWIETSKLKAGEQDPSSTKVLSTTPTTPAK